MPFDDAYIAAIASCRLDGHGGEVNRLISHFTRLNYGSGFQANSSVATEVGSINNVYCEGSDRRSIDR